jgi:hypothetical protein
LDRFLQPCQKTRMDSILETVSMIAEFGQQRIFGSVIGHLGAEIEFLSFHRKW